MFGSTSGHIADMVNRLHWNREQLLRRKKHMTHEEDGFIYFDSHIELKFREGTPEERQQIRAKIKSDLKRQHRIELGMLIVSILLFVAAFGWFTRNFI